MAVVITEGTSFWIVTHKDDCTAYFALKGINQLLAVVVFFVIMAALLTKELGWGW